MSDPGATTLPRGDLSRRAGAAEAPQLYLRLVYGEWAAPADPALGTIAAFAKGATPLTIGRVPAGDHTLALPADRWASRNHARFLPVVAGRERGLLVEDLGSRNGTQVDGQPAQGRVGVVAGQVVRVGSTLFVVAEAPLDRRSQVLDDAPPPADLVLWSWPMVELWERMSRVAPSPAGVLLLGELGTGKTRLAEEIHRLSGAGGPFVPHNCSAIPLNLEEATLFGIVAGFIPSVKARQGLITMARGGTLFLDEVADMPPGAQAKLLDAFDPRQGSYLPVGGNKRLETQCRLLCATNRPVYGGEVRHDLISRLVVTQLTVPPLRDRREDIMPLFRAALARGGQPDAQPGVEAAEAMLLAPWTENVRGLESLATRAVIGEAIDPALVREHASRGATPRPGTSSPHSPSGRPAAAPAAPATAAWPPSPAELLAVLDRHHWNVKDAAEEFGRRRETVSRQLTRSFGSGGKASAQRAHQVWRRTGKVPGPDVDAAHALFFEQPETSETAAARQAWIDRQ